MIIFKTLSKIFHNLIIFSFFLAFVPKGCSVSQKELEEKAIADSIRINDSISIYNKEISDSAKRVLISNLLIGKNKIKPTSTEKLISRFHYLRPILRPNDGYSGIELMCKSQNFIFLTI